MRSTAKGAAVHAPLFPQKHMSSMLHMSEFIQQLTSISERQRENEQKAARLILDILRHTHTPVHIQRFPATTPVIQNAQLIADGKNIPAIATCFVSGAIHCKHALTSSLISSQRMLFDANINFNPQSKSISRSNHYFAPSVAISKQDVAVILDAKQVRGSVQVKAVRHTSMNILVGNLASPEYILFCHYDSFGPGAIDNASGTAVLLKLAIDYPQLRQNCLFVIAGNEELSYDKPIYWGHGYRVFERTHLRILKRAKHLLMIDCVGNGRTHIDQSIDMLRLGFPIVHVEEWKKKMCVLYGDNEKLMEVYHSELDTPDLIQERYLNDAVRTCMKVITSS